MVRGRSNEAFCESCKFDPKEPPSFQNDKLGSTLFHERIELRRARARSLHPLACPSAFLWLLQQSGEAPHMQVPISHHRVRAYTVKEYNDTNVKPRRRTQHAQSTPCSIDATPNQRHARRSKPTKPWRGTKWGTRVLSRLTPLTSSWVAHRGQDGARDGSQSQRSTQCT